MKRWMSLFLAVGMIAAMLVGFGTTAVAEELIPLTATMRCHTASEDLNDNEFLRSLATEAGIEITWDCVYSDLDVKRATMLASGDLTDMFFGNDVMRVTDIAANVGFFAPLSELIGEVAPNIQRAIDTDDAYKKMVTSLDGEIYTLGCRAPFRPTTYTTMFINKAWLDVLNLDMPNTTDEFVEVMKAFKEGDPNGNGDADEMPVVMNMFRSDDAWGVRCFMGAFGCESSIDSLFALVDDTVVYRPITEEFRDYMNWIALLKSEGIMDEELASATWDTIMARVTSDEPLVGVTNLWTSALLDASVRDQYVQMPPLEGPKGDRYVAYNPISPVYESTPKFALSEFCENKEAALKFVDLFFTNENAMQINCGVKDVALEQVDGKWTLKQPPEGMDSDTFIYKTSMREMWPFYIEQAWTDENMIVSYHDGEKMGYDALNQDYVRDTPQYMPPQKFDDETNEELGPLVNEIETYMYSTLMEWFVEGGVDEGWDAYIDEMKAIGVDRYIQIYQDAYDAQK